MEYIPFVSPDPSSTLWLVLVPLQPLLISPTLPLICSLPTVDSSLQCMIMNENTYCSASMTPQHHCNQHPPPHVSFCCPCLPFTGRKINFTIEKHLESSPCCGVGFGWYSVWRRRDRKYSVCEKTRIKLNDFPHHKLQLGCDFRCMTVSKFIHIKRVKLVVWLAGEDATVTADNVDFFTQSTEVGGAR